MPKLDIPDSWAEARLETVCEVNPRNKDLDDNLNVGFVPMASVSEEGFVKGHEVREWSKVKKGFTHFADNDVIFAKITPCMENKKSAIVSGMPNGVGCGSTEFHVLRSKGVLMPEYLLGYLRQDSFVANAESNMTGSAGQKRVPTTWLIQQNLPVPPLGEQKRIVGKIESTGSKIKAIEQSVTKAEELIGKYRESLLQKAFRGELVPQDPNDEPASQLLARIRKDREKLSDGKKKKKDDLPPIKPEEIPFAIPKSWEWVRLGNILHFQNGYSFKSSEWAKSGLPIIRIQNLNRNGGGEFNYFNGTPAPEWTIHAGDLLFAWSGSKGVSFGAHIWNGATGVLNQHIFKVTPDSGINKSYLYWLLRQFQSRIEDDAHGFKETFVHVKQSDLKNVVVPIPPSSEQGKISEVLSAATKANDAQLTTLNTALIALSKLKCSVLVSAFSGRLVPQVSSEGTGHELLASIKIDANAKAKPTSKCPVKLKASRRPHAR